QETPVESINSLLSGKDYLLKAYGMANAGDTIDFDAEYSLTNRIPGDTWTDAVSGYESWGGDLLDLQIKSLSTDWGVFNPQHIYWKDWSGTGSNLSFKVYDIYYPNNVGNLFVDIFAKLY
ncbi:MAG: hypothetical protein Q8P89_00315, partial [bacterium]|nr:hypothetical protein [bacterium]